MYKRPLLFASALVALATAAQGGEDPAARGASLLAPFKAELKNALMEGMKEGPATAIGVCSEDAPVIAASLSVDGVQMGRSSHKLRNPGNAAADWLAPVIAAYASGEREQAPIAAVPYALIAICMVRLAGISLSGITKSYILCCQGTPGV